MHPAFSVLVFTVVSGAGYGLAFLMVLGHLIGLSALQDQTLLLSGGVLAFVMISGGLLSSTLHLANPKNAWRAFSRFKTSWLSREAVFAILFYPFFMLYLLGVYLDGEQIAAVYVLAGGVSIALAMVTLFCTSMIYASLKTIRQWNSALTPVNYLALGLMSGSVLLIALHALIVQSVSPLLNNLVMALLVVGLVVNVIYFLCIVTPSGSIFKTATGFTQASVRLLDQGHTSNGFLNNEFGYTVAANQLLRIRLAALVVAFVVPMLLVLAGGGALLLIAAIATLAGLLAERWLFFAEARHVVRLFHGDQNV
jgi:DMSO reductase anchor subunit